MNASNEDAESVDAFLERIASLKDKRDREDEERTRKLEQDILQGRRERQARRAERARSISPQKNSQPTASSISQDPLYYGSSPEHAPQSQFNLSPSPQPPFMEESAQPGPLKASARNDTSPGLPPSPTKSSARSSTNATTFSRTGTLSWQQRPSSRDSNPPRSRPHSRQTDEVASAARDAVDDGPTRDQIALSLDLKDPSWFRQTADRGASSSAYRKNKEEVPLHIGQSTRQLPGLSLSKSVEPEKAPLTSSTIESPLFPSQASSAPDNGDRGNRFSSMSSQSTLGGARSHLRTDSHQRFGIPADGLDNDQPGAQRSTLPSSQGQLSRDRPSSPTKGLGGFVQSAMMKRSDSVNKRWSAQAAPGLSRGNSVASYRGGIAHSGSVIEGAGSPPRNNKEASRGPASSPVAISRPTSSHSTSTVLHHAESTSLSSVPQTFSSLAIPPSAQPDDLKKRSTTEDDLKEQEIKTKSPVLRSLDTLPVSPTKTMDPKRWSPTKASWLESALARPESPKLTSPKPQTPSWMADLQKSKLSKEDSASVKSPASSFTMVSPAGLMRSPPPGGHTRPLSIGGLPEGFSSGPTRKQYPEQPQEGIVEEKQAEQPVSHALSKQEPPSPTTHSSKHPESPGAKAARETVERKEMPISTPEPDGKSPPREAKPLTPTKTDFRANLRSRQNTSEDSTSTEPEFKNVFSRLKRTQTKNYVPPDELKDNILRGKAALNLTSGPQKPQRVDDFKESILKKKESMKAEAVLPRKNVAAAGLANTALQLPETLPEALPEALTKRKALNKHTEISKAPSADIAPLSKPAALRSVLTKAEEKNMPSPDGKSRPSEKPARPYKDVELTNTDLNLTKSRQPETTNIDQAPSSDGKETGLTNMPVFANGPLSLAKLPSPVTETTKKSIDNKPVGKLASRLNPSLAGILLRGPPSTSSSRNASSEEVSSIMTAEPAAPTDEPRASSVGPLTHTTKARARGPKRRLPKTSALSTKSEDQPQKPNPTDVLDETLHDTKAHNPNNNALPADPQSGGESQNATVAPRPLVDLDNNADKVSNLKSMGKKSLPPESMNDLAQETEAEPAPDSEDKRKTKPAVAAKSSTLRKVSSPPSAKIAVTGKIAPKPSPSEGRMSERVKAGSQYGPEKAVEKPREVSHPTNVRQRKASTSMNPTSPPISIPSLRQNLPDPQVDADIDGTPASARKPALSGLGLKLDSRKLQPPSSQLTPPPEERSTKALGSWQTSAQVPSKDSAKVQNRSLSQQPGLEVSELLTEFFDEKPKIHDKVEVDAQAIILNRPSSDSKSKVLKAQVWQINPDGKKESLPPQQEHILFEDCMYLCVHSFTAAAGSSATEVYLWGGDGVSEAALEDAQLFCRKEARENNTKLELLRQGKEPPKFFQALGGIVITRRSRNSSLYMLCGRRYLGHVAFDEVDLNAASLCSGFPYLISAKFGKLYLWKGKGSGADEVGCARLIGMDLGLTGEIEEVDEGQEPPNFLESFGGSMGPRLSSQQWSLKSRSDQYGCRLFRVELEQSRGMTAFWTRRGSSPAKATKASIQEIYPFCQRDLDSRCIFVLDAYFNIFVYVGAEAGPKSAEFVTALIFAQEYGILAASLEDRPAIPNCNITFYGAPLNFTAAFRKWEGPSGTKNQQQEKCQVIALNDALEVLSNRSAQV